MSMSSEAIELQDMSRSWPKVVKYGLPGGFCAGVERSVQASRDFVKKHPRGTVFFVGSPAHNPNVVNEFVRKGVTFVDSVDQVPNNGNVIVGPHGNTDQDVQILQNGVQTENADILVEDRQLGLEEIVMQERDFVLTECPLVTKVKTEIRRNTNDGYITIYYGQLSKNKEGKIIPHPETRAAMSAGDVRLITSLGEALSDDLYDQIEDPTKVAFATQTTHNADEALEMAEELLEIFPQMRLPKTDDICYATRDRQKAAKAVIDGGAEVVVVVGDKKTSSNTRSLASTAENKGARAIIVNSRKELKPEDFFGSSSVGIVASASAPIMQIQGVIGFFEKRGSILQRVEVADESNIHFAPPKARTAFVPQIIWKSSVVS